MGSSSTRAYKRAASLGAIAGLRSLAAPALLSRHARRNKGINLDGTPFAWLASPAAATGISLLAGGEVLGDKAPFMPARTSPPALLGRAGAGALVGAAVFAADDKPIAIGVVVGVVAAVAATFAAYHLRKLAGEKSGLPDPIFGLVEDAIVAGSGWCVLNVE